MLFLTARRKDIPLQSGRRVLISGVTGILRYGLGGGSIFIVFATFDHDQGNDHGDDKAPDVQPEIVSFLFHSVYLVIYAHMTSLCAPLKRNKTLLEAPADLFDLNQTASMFIALDRGGNSR
jgi:Mg2+ and Co2+ transporter CorA